MKCYYHGDMDAVATCQTCGKSLCRECAGEYSPCRCYDCAKQAKVEREIKKKYDKEMDLIDTKAEFIGAMVKGVIAVIVLLAIMLATHNVMWQGLVIIFFAPYGWPFAARLGWTDSMGVNIFLFFIKWSICIIVGIPMVIFHVIKFVKRLNDNKKM